MTSIYQQENPLAARVRECARLAAKHPNMIPVVLERQGKKDKAAFSVLPPSATVADLERVVRDVADLKDHKPVTLSVDGCTPAQSTTMADLHAACKNEDGMLYIAYTGEKRLGGAPASCKLKT